MSNLLPPALVAPHDGLLAHAAVVESALAGLLVSDLQVRASYAARAVRSFNKTCQIKATQYNNFHTNIRTTRT